MGLKGEHFCKMLKVLDPDLKWLKNPKILNQGESPSKQGKYSNTGTSKSNR